MNETIKKLARHYKVRVYFYKKFNGLGGYYNTQTHSIHIWRGKQDHLSVFFHELGHHHCNMNGIWPAYHNGFVYTRKKLSAFMLTAYKAERWVDRWAQKEMMKFFPKRRYSGYYLTPGSKKAFKEGFLAQVKASIR